MKTRPDTPVLSLGSIHENEVMPSREFCRRFGFGRKAWTALLHRGFPSIECGKQRLVDGRSALAYFRGLANGEGQG